MVNALSGLVVGRTFDFYSMMMPRVTILMPIHNGEQYLSEAIESVFCQTFTDFELVTIDDGSTDRTSDILREYQKLDKRLVVKRYTRNLGLSVHLYDAKSVTRGEYFARMDADDICLPHRLEEQVVFLDRHPEISVCGTWVETFGKSKQEVWKYPVDHEAICARMLFSNTIAHPSVMLRMSTFTRQHLWYEKNVPYAQDYDLWSNAVPYLRFANIPKVLMRYRLHPTNIGSIRGDAQKARRFVIYRRLLFYIGIEPSEVELMLHEKLGQYEYEDNIAFLEDARKWLEKISYANQLKKFVVPNVMSNELGERWTQMCQQARAPLPQVLSNIFNSPLPFRKTKGPMKILPMMRLMLKRMMSRVGA